MRVSLSSLKGSPLVFRYRAPRIKMQYCNTPLLRSPYVSPFVSGGVSIWTLYGAFQHQFNLLLAAVYHFFPRYTFASAFFAIVAYSLLFAGFNPFRLVF